MKLLKVNLLSIALFAAAAGAVAPTSTADGEKYLCVGEGNTCRLLVDEDWVDRKAWKPDT